MLRLRDMDLRVVKTALNEGEGNIMFFEQQTRRKKTKLTMLETLQLSACFQANITA